MNQRLHKYLASRALWPLIALLIAINLWLGIKAGGDNLLRNSAAPNGIISLEVAGSMGAAEAIMQSWNRLLPDGTTLLLDVARQSLKWDYVFILFYTITLALGCLISASIIDTRHEKLKRLGLVKVGWMLICSQVLVAALDATENVALWMVLHGSKSNSWPVLSKWCAVPKFGLIGISFFYMFLTFIIWIGESHKRRPFSVIAGQHLGEPPYVK
ncbi:MAG TPA: hypothetical protein VF717_08540 [Pyrinomonadaceae bacterium]|jgi:hypothetical protein